MHETVFCCSKTFIGKIFLNESGCKNSRKVRFIAQPTIRQSHNNPISDLPHDLCWPNLSPACISIQHMIFNQY